MNRMKKIAALLLVCVLVFALAGCGKMTPEKLTVKLVESTTGKTMTQATTTMDIEMDMTIGAAGMTTEMGMDVNYVMNMKMQADPYLVYADLAMDMAMEAMGQTMEETVNSEIYVELVDGQIVGYVFDESTGSWQTSDVDMTEMLESVGKNMDYTFMKDMIPEIVLDEEKQTMNGKEVYVVRMTITGEQMQKATGGAVDMGSILGQAGLDVEMDFSALSVPTVMYIDAETYLPVRVEMEMIGMDEMMKSMLNQMILGGMEGIEMDVTIPVCKVVYENISFDPVEVPEIPAEAKN